MRENKKFFKKFFIQNKHLFQMKGAEYNKKWLFCKGGNYTPIWNKLSLVKKTSLRF